VNELSHLELWQQYALIVGALLLVVLLARVIGRWLQQPAQRTRAPTSSEGTATQSAAKPVPPPQQPRRAVLFMGEATREKLCAVLPIPYICVKNRAEFVAAAKPESACVAFADVDLLLQLDRKAPKIPLVGVIDAPTDTLSKTVKTYETYQWLSHVVSATIFATPHAKQHLAMFIQRIVDGPDVGVISTTSIGRVALLARASKRETRFERMNEFFTKHGLSSRLLTAIHDIAEELVMNALYDAPLEAGFFKDAVPRTEDVDLPANRACEISYGIEAGNVFVRLRDPFGALNRRRLLDVLSRCNSENVQLDESRGGAGLGLWRVFSTASTITVTVIDHRLTDFVVWIAPKNGKLAKQLLAVHLFFQTDNHLDSESLMIEDGDSELDRSVTLVA